MTQAAPRFSHIISSWRENCRRTGLPTACDNIAASNETASAPFKSIASRAAHIDHAHALERHVQQLGHDAPRGIGRLSCGPDGRLVRLDIGHRTRRAHRAVHLIRIGIPRSQNCAGRGKLLCRRRRNRRSECRAKAASADVRRSSVCGGSSGPGFHRTTNWRAASIAWYCVSATTPTKSLRTTTFTARNVPHRTLVHRDAASLPSPAA